MTVRIPVTIAAQHDALAVERLVLRSPEYAVDELPDPLRELAQRVVREVQAQQLLLPAEPLADRGLGRGRQRPLQGAASSPPMSNSEVWPLIRSRCAAWPAAMASSRPSRICAGCPKHVERADLGQRLQHLAVDEAQVDPGAEVGERAELAARLAGRDDRLDGALAHVLDRQQPEPDGVALDREVEARLGGRPAAAPRCPGGGTRRRPRRPSPCCPGRPSARRSCTRPCSSP